MRPVFLSIVIPAYNEEAIIDGTLRQVAEFLTTREYTWEVVVADDGSTDATAQLVGQFAQDDPRVRLLRLSHQGKGGAVREGMLEANGQFRFLCDADLSMPIEQVERFLPPRVKGLDLAIGSREVSGARRIGEPAYRHLMGRFYNALVRLLAVPGFRDTQCGFKCFRGEIVPLLFRRQTMDGFAFDVEVLFLAQKEKLNIGEIGIDWHFRQRSKVRPLRDALAMTGDLLNIRWHNWRGRYDRVYTSDAADQKTPGNDRNGG